MVTVKYPASLMCQSLPSLSRFQNVQAVTVRAHRAAFKNVGHRATGFGVATHDAVESRARLFETEHSHSATGAAASYLRSEQPFGNALRADEVHQQIRGVAAQAAFRVGTVRFIHDLAHLRESHSAASQFRKQVQDRKSVV